MEPTQLTKSETFALNLATMITIYGALKQAEDKPASVQAEIKAAVIDAMLNHPTPAEA